MMQVYADAGLCRFFVTTYIAGFIISHVVPQSLSIKVSNQCMYKKNTISTASSTPHEKDLLAISVVFLFFESEDSSLVPGYHHGNLH